MSEMIERVAKALCLSKYASELADGLLDLGAATLDDHVAQTWRDFTDDARAAIEAMREPGDVALSAGSSAMNGHPTYDAGHRVRTLHVGWNAIIDAALA